MVARLYTVHRQGLVEAGEAQRTEDESRAAARENVSVAAEKERSRRMSQTTASPPAQQCNKCHKTSADIDSAKLLRCSACVSVFYCSKQCQKDDWKVHKVKCKELKAAKAAAAAK